MHFKKKVIFMIIALPALNLATFAKTTPNILDIKAEYATSKLKNAVGSSALNIQQRKVTGTVTDQAGVPVAGANVAVKGTSNATTTDFDGKFSIDVPEKGKLEISYVGFTTQTLEISGKSTYNVKLAQDSKSLDEVVITGYAAQSKKNITGSVVTMKVSDDLRLAATTNAGNILQGRLAGVLVSAQNGLPGSQPSISIRTGSSFNAQNVLYVIDGVIKGGGDFNNLSPNEIETVTVLKDASAAAVYGSRSAGGVIVVTTKRGEAGKMRIDYSYSYGQDTRTKNAALASGYDMGVLYNKTVPANDPSRWTPEDLAFMKSVNNGWGYDQLDLVWTNPTIKTQNLSVSGGTEKVKYFAGISNVQQTTFVKAYGYDKTNARFNTTINLTDNLQFFAGIGFQKQFTDSDSFGGPADLYKKLLVWQWYQPVYTDSGKYADYGWIANVGAEAAKASGYNQTTNFKPDVNLNLTYKIPYVQGLTAKASYAASWTNSHNDQYKHFYQMATLKQSPNGHIVYTDDASITSMRNNTAFTYPSLYKASNWSQDYQIQAQLNYDRTFGKHSVQGGLTYEAFE